MRITLNHYGCNEKKYFYKREKGITLIALVLTIIVLLILAGVSINIIVGKDRTNLIVNNNESIPTEDILGDYSNKKISKNAICGYWCNYISSDDFVPMKLSDIPDYYEVINVAFARSDGNKNGAIKFELNEYLSETLNYSNEEFKKDIIDLQNKNKKVILSIGGSNDKNINITNEDEALNFANSVIEKINEYNFNGIDIDIENGNIETKYFEDAIMKISDNYASNLFITINSSATEMRSTNVNNGIDNIWYRISKDLKDILALISIRYYNSGMQRGFDYEQIYSREQGHISFITALATKFLEDKNFNHRQVGICILGYNEPQGDDLPQAFMEADKIVLALSSLIEGKDVHDSYKNFIPPTSYPDIGPTTIWSINNDAYNNYEMSRSIYSYISSR